jgi:hypothetical protein
MSLVAWQIYLVVSIIVAALFFVASLTLVKPGSWRNLRRSKQRKSNPQQEIETKVPVEA